MQMCAHECATGRVRVCARCTPLERQRSRAAQDNSGFEWFAMQGKHAAEDSLGMLHRALLNLSSSSEHGVLRCSGEDRVCVRVVMYAEFPWECFLFECIYDCMPGCASFCVCVTVCVRVCECVRICKDMCACEHLCMSVLVCVCARASRSSYHQTLSIFISFLNLSLPAWSNYSSISHLPLRTSQNRLTQGAQTQTV